MEAMGPYATKGEFHDSPVSEHKGDQDEIDLAIFGKRPQLKRKFGFISMVGLTCTLMATWEGLFSWVSSNLCRGTRIG